MSRSAQPADVERAQHHLPGLLPALQGAGCSPPLQVMTDSDPKPTLRFVADLYPYPRRIYSFGSFFGLSQRGLLISEKIN